MKSVEGEKAHEGKKVHDQTSKEHKRKILGGSHVQGT